MPTTTAPDSNNTGIAARIEELLSSMSLAEKSGQLTQLLLFREPPRRARALG